MSIPGLGHLGAGALAMLIPIVAIIGAFATGMFALYHKAQRQREMLKLYHAERMAAIEKGIELPPLQTELVNDHSYGCCGKYDPARHRYRGVMTLLVGVAITLAMWKTGGGDRFWWGLIIVAVGLGQLVIGLLERRDRALNPPGAPPQAGGTGNSTFPGRS